MWLLVKLTGVTFKLAVCLFGPNSRAVSYRLSVILLYHLAVTKEVSMRTLLVALPALLLLSNCGDSANSPKGELPMAITMKSPAFEVNGVIPKKHTGEGDDVSPALDWSGVPKEIGRASCRERV